jgi:MoxR-like ATPase
MGLLTEIVVGWDSIEPILLACIACEKNIILRGKHGASKTAVAKIIAESLGSKHRHYDATKADLITIAGIPNPKSISDPEKPRLEYAKHDQTIWEAEYISIDELTRAPREAQNLWLSILEEKTLQGKPLVYKAAIATMNPSTYAATNRVDEALFDRFYAVMDVPDIMREGDARKNILAMLQMTRDGKTVRDEKQIAVLGQAMDEIRSTFQSFKAQDALVNPVESYVAAFFVELAANHKGYISGRKFDHVRDCIYAVAAYFKTMENLGSKVNAPDGLFAIAAQHAVTFVVGTALDIQATTIFSCHEKAVKVLKGLSGSASDTIRKEIHAANTIKKRIAVLEKHINAVASLPPSEMHAVIATATNDSMLVDFKDKKVDKKSAILGVAEAVDNIVPFLEKLRTMKNPAAKAAASSMAGSYLSEGLAQINNFIESMSDKLLGNNTVRYVTYNKLAGKKVENPFTKVYENGFSNGMTAAVENLLKEMQKIS